MTIPKNHAVSKKPEIRLSGIIGLSDRKDLLSARGEESPGGLGDLRTSTSLSLSLSFSPLPDTSVSRRMCFLISLFFTLHDTLGL